MSWGLFSLIICHPDIIAKSIKYKATFFSPAVAFRIIRNRGLLRQLRCLNLATAKVLSHAGCFSFLFTSFVIYSAIFFKYIVLLHVFAFTTVSWSLYLATVRLISIFCFWHKRKTKQQKRKKRQLNRNNMQQTLNISTFETPRLAANMLRYLHHLLQIYN